MHNKKNYTFRNSFNFPRPIFSLLLQQFTNSYKKNPITYISSAASMEESSTVRKQLQDFKKGLTTKYLWTCKFNVWDFSLTTANVAATCRVASTRCFPLKHGTARGTANGLLCHTVAQTSQRVAKLEGAAHRGPLWALNTSSYCNLSRRAPRRQLLLSSELGRQAVWWGDADNNLRCRHLRWSLAGAWWVIVLDCIVHLAVCGLLCVCVHLVFPYQLWFFVLHLFCFTTVLRRLAHILCGLWLCLFLFAGGAFGLCSGALLRGGGLRNRFFFSNEVQWFDRCATEVTAPPLGKPWQERNIYTVKSYKPKAKYVRISQGRRNVKMLTSLLKWNQQTFSLLDCLLDGPQILASFDYFFSVMVFLALIPVHH